MKIKKILSVILVFTAALTLFSGCVQSGPASQSSTADPASSEAAPASSESASPAAPAETKAVTYWGWDSNFNEPMGKFFEEENPGYKLEVTALAHADYLAKIQQTVASNSQLPDILLGESNLRGKLFELDIWEDLSKDPYNLSHDMFFDFTKSRTVNAKGELIGVEMSLSPAAMAYKRDLAKEYFGTDDRAELEKMFADMSAYPAKAKEVQEKSGGETYLFHSSGLVMEWLYFSNPTAIVGAGGELDFTGKMTDILNNLADLRDAGAIDKFQMGTPQGNAAYADQNHIFYPCPNWAIDYYIKSNDPNGSGNWGLMIPATGGYSAGGTVMGISKTALNKEGAWKFIEWSTLTQQGVDHMKNDINYYVPTKEFYSDASFVSKVDPFFADQDTGAIFYNEIVPVIKAAAVSPFDTVMYDITQLLAQSMIADPALTADAALQKGIEEAKNKFPDSAVI